MPHIAEKVCYAMAQLAAGFKDDDSTSLFSPYFKDIVGALLDAVRLCLPTPQFNLPLNVRQTEMFTCGSLFARQSKMRKRRKQFSNLAWQCALYTCIGKRA